MTPKEAVNSIKHKFTASPSAVVLTKAEWDVILPNLVYDLPNPDPYFEPDDDLFIDGINFFTPPGG